MNRLSVFQYELFGLAWQVHLETKLFLEKVILYLSPFSYLENFV